MVCGKTSARLAKKRQDHTSQRQSTQYVEPPAHCQSQGASSSSQTPIEAAVLATNKDPVTCPPGELNPRCPLQHSTSLSPSVEESAAAWLRMTEKQVRSQILSRKAPERDVMAVLQAMSALDSRQHSTMAASLTSWFQTQWLQTDTKQNSTTNPQLCVSDAPQQAVPGFERVASTACDADVPVCRNSSDVSAITACLATTGELCAAASDAAQLDEMQGMGKVRNMPVAEAPLPGDVGVDMVAALTLGRDSVGNMQGGDPAAPCVADVGVGRPDWMGVTEHVACHDFLEDDKLFEGLAPLDGTLEGLEDGIDVRNLWAGGDSLEAWSDCTMSELTFDDSESVTGAILECFKDPIWRFYEPPDELPSTFVSAAIAPDVGELAVQAVASPVEAAAEVAAVRQCHQESAMDFLFEAVDPLDNSQPGGCWNDPDYTPGTLQAWEKSAKAQRKGASKAVADDVSGTRRRANSKRQSQTPHNAEAAQAGPPTLQTTAGEMVAVRQACDGVAGTSAALDLHNNFALPEGNAMCGQQPAQVCMLLPGTNSVAPQSSKSWPQVKKAKVGKKSGVKAVGVKKGGKGKQPKTKGKASKSDSF